MTAPKLQTPANEKLQPTHPDELHPARPLSDCVQLHPTTRADIARYARCSHFSTAVAGDAIVCVTCLEVLAR